MSVLRTSLMALIFPSRSSYTDFDRMFRKQRMVLVEGAVLYMDCARIRMKMGLRVQSRDILAAPSLYQRPASLPIAGECHEHPEHY